MTGSSAALTVTREELHDRVLTFVRRRVPSLDDAEDIAQEVMLRIHRHSADLEHADRMTAWVYRIAANAITDLYRRPARREVPSGYAVDVSEPHPDVVLIAGEPSAATRRALVKELEAFVARQSSIISA